MEIGELDKLYREAEAVDEQIFSEMRSNILLVSGDHYNKRTSKYWERVQTSKGLKESSKLRLTKNHTATICRRKVGKLLSHAPNTKITPNNPDEIQDQKTAELNDTVWKHTKKKHKMRSKIRSWAEDFINMGECWAKIYWDDTKGDLVGYEQAMDEDDSPMYKEMDHEQCMEKMCEMAEQGRMPMVGQEEMMAANPESMKEMMMSYGAEESEMMGEPDMDDTKPVMSGDFVFERMFAFNMMRDPNSQSVDESPYIINRKMVDKSQVKKMMKAEEFDRINSDEESYLVFDSDTANYSNEKNKMMLREFYFRPSMEYPKGQFFITVKGHLIEEGELPFGIFNIIYAGHTEIPTSCRHRSPIKQMRPYQIEINRAASKIAETQITLGDDKLILNNNAKISSGGTLAGIRGVKVQGGGDDIKILPGRSGDQYLPYMQSQISELYQVMDEQEMESSGGQFDAYAMLYYSSRNKERYKKYAEEFEDFITEITEVYLRLAKEYYDEETLIPMIGKTEMVNIAEFKHTEKNSFRIQVENIADDADTMMGRQLSINQVLQYVGKDLDQDSVGKMIKNMPFMNQDEMFDDLTIDYDMSKNDMLAIERGEMPPLGRYDNHKYLIKRVTSRIKKPDFRFLDPQVQQMYQQYTQQHEEIEAKQAMELQRAQAGFIPTTGAQAKADLYVTNAEGKVERATFPAASLEWLREQLQSQGEVLDPINDMPQGVQAEMAQMMPQQQQQPIPM